MKSLSIVTACVMLLSFMFACKKADNTPLYVGEIRRQTTDCTSSKGFIFIIKVSNTPLYDSIYTSTLPREFWPLIGKQINFRVREYTTGENDIICNTQIIGPKFYVIYDVTK